MAFKFNPLTGNFDIVDKTIPQLTADPASPAQETTWVLREGAGATGGGKPIGLLLSLTTTGSGNSFTYKLSYRTKDGTTKRVELT